MSQRSILNYFSKTPTSKPGSPSSASASPTTDKSHSSPSGQGAQAIVVTPKRPGSIPASSKSNKAKDSTPSSNGNGKSRQQKRGPSPDEEPTAQPNTPNRVKRYKTEDASPTKDFSEGAMVWAKLEGYPFWPAMIRGEEIGKPFWRNNRTEFHVQFFDNPPSRAWIRKPDLKLYKSSTDGAVPPARNDPTWVKNCKLADVALAMSPAKRIEKYWIDFGPQSEEEDLVQTSPVETKPESQSPKSRNSQSKSAPRRRIQVIVDSSDESEQDSTPSKKKKTPIVTTPVAHKKNGRGSVSRTPKGNDDSDGEDEYKPSSADVTMESEEESSELESEPETSSDEDDDGEAKTPKRSKKSGGKSKKSAVTPKTPTNSKSNNNTPASSAKRAEFQNKIAKFANYDSPVPSPSSKSNGADSGQKWTHLSLKFLKPEEIKDKKMRRPDHPDYDPRTLHVPSRDLDSFSPGVRQWWVLKSENFDTVLFFKLGKFYEMYHMDAVIGVQELGLIYMKGEFAHCGFPEIAYSHNAATLVAKGYKVARVEQTETPEMMEQRCKKTSRPTKFDRVVKREICQITTKGIRLASVQDVSSMPFHPSSEYLYAIAEMPSEDGGTEYGTCFIDTTLGTFHIGQFKDDRNFSRLRTMFSHHTPAQILYEKNKMNPAVLGVLYNMSGVRKDALSATEFWSGEKVLKFLMEGKYFSKEDDPEATNWPKKLLSICNKSSLQLTPLEGWSLGLKCLGAVIWYLKSCLVEHDLINLGQFDFYFPVDMAPSELDMPSFKPKMDHMVLDGATLRNLEITEGPKSLFSIMDKCSTQFGKRLLRHWMCLPEANPQNINSRLDAIEELINLQDLIDKVTPMLKTLLDLERLLGKIHALGSLHRSTDHPDARASMYEEKQYSKRKISDLTNVLKNFKTCVTIMNTIKDWDTQITSEYLSGVISKFPSLDKLLKFFDTAFDHAAALQAGKIQPNPGVDEDYDAAVQGVEDVQEEANAYLKEMKSKLGSKVVYFGTEKKRFQLEVAATVRVPNDFEMSSSKKGFKRYVTTKTKALLAKLIQAEINRENVVKDITRRVFAKFDTHRDIWNAAVRTISVLDVLFSLTAFSKSSDKMSRPRVVASASPFISITEGWHPAVSQDTYIPNNCALGNESGPKDGSPGTFVLLTGPNMGGKSTMMRQVGIMTVLAHMGVYVPATKCEMSVVDRIFTRLGANDNIGEGESTFFVELSETSSILQHSTQNSLVLIDELGRGTATYDGTAIALAVAQKLAARNLRGIFSTHYHSLVTMMDAPQVQLGHMACMVEKENEDDDNDDPTQETLTFLYQLAPGPCPKSYGFNAARLAGIPHDVIRVAHSKAKEMEAKVNKVNQFVQLCSAIETLKLVS